MVAFGQCGVCKGTMAYKDGRPKCLLCGNEPSLEDIKK